ncbi:MAG: hypothetical protein UV80_C0002G0114 [Candidatus Peregrinibacteria bacterium GW2011_GWF2_43_17]|nr:MAG: hypothetical protein UV80_C0002G0114 [Candidatus Peregrinibacteria bacterium GW2011_GWF2_43_17]KKT18529.1 MAG: hypothetical protein UW03_C0039G0002 [Candidatus Peregrinibacteria bacterium GW2011_GWA2_43_8]HAU39841.1 hypothetical protein [Candidatus Peregrinibacteria bacterium]
MLIAIDASRYGHEQSTGVEKYSYEIIRRIYKLAKKDGHNVRLYVREFSDDFPKTDQVLIKRKRLWTLVGLSWEIFKHKPDVLFVPSHVLPLIRPKKSVMMIHDIAFERYPEVYTWKQRKYLRWSTKYAVKYATKIIAPSKFTANELRSVYSCPKEKIEVIHHGVNENAVPGRHIDDGKYLLFIGRIENKKNLMRLINAFSSLPLYDFKLVLAGKDGDGAGKIKKPSHERVIFTGYVDENKKATLLKNAYMFCFVSLYEGFGMPVLEAFKAGVPVLASNIEPLREVGGAACYYVDPKSEEDIAIGISEMIRDLPMRERMVGMGYERLSGFDWEKSAEKTFQILCNRLE